MSRVDGLGLAAQARFAAEQARLETRRQAELLRAQELAGEVKASLEGAQGPSPEVLGRVLAEAQRLLPEAREAVARHFALAQGPTAVSSPTGDEATLVQAAVDKACPPGSESRQSLGAALLRAAGLSAAGVGPELLETAVSRALSALAPRAATTPRPPAPTDRMERAEARRIGDPPSAVPPPTPSSTPAPSAVPPAALTTEATVVSTAPTAPAGGFLQATVSAVSVARAHPAEAQRLADAASDMQALKQVLGGAEPMAMASASPAVGSVEATSADGGAAVVSAAASRLFGIERLSWEGTAPKLLGPRLDKVSGSLGTLYDKAEGIRQALVRAESRRATVRRGLRVAAGQLDRVAHRIGIARELATLPGDSRSSLRRVVGAREALSGVGSEAERALETLSGLRVHGLPRAMSEIREVARLARVNENELRTSYAVGAMLDQIDAGAGLFAEAAAAPVPGEVSAEDPSAVRQAAEGESAGPGVLSEVDLARLGSALDPSKPAAQGVWTEEMVDTGADRGRKRGGVTDADGARHLEIARMALGAEGRSLEGPGHELAPADLLAVLKMAGVPLEKVDPNQLASAARYVSSATSLADQQEKLRKTLDNFQILATTGLPRMDRQLMVEQLWATTRVPGHALEKLSDAEMQRKFQEVAAALNGGPGPSQIRIGSHNLELELGETGQVLSSSCEKPSALSKVWNVVDAWIKG